MEGHALRVAFPLDRLTIAIGFAMAAQIRTSQPRDKERAHRSTYKPNASGTSAETLLLMARLTVVAEQEFRLGRAEHAQWLGRVAALLQVGH